MTRDQIIALAAALVVLIPAVVKLWASKLSRNAKIFWSIALVAIIIGLVVVVFNWNIPQGRIISPQDGDSVSRAFTVEGTTRDIPRDKHLWVVVQVSNRLFPKEPEIPRVDRHWNQDIFEGGNPPGGKFSIILMMVDSRGNDEIEAWLDKVRRNESAPGLTKITGSSKLDAVTLTLSPP